MRPTTTRASPSTNAFGLTAAQSIRAPTVDQAINGGYPWLEIACSRCKAKRDVDLAGLPHVSTTFVHDLASRLVCQKCKAAGKRPSATLLQLTPRQRHEETKP